LQFPCANKPRAFALTNLATGSSMFAVESFAVESFAFESFAFEKDPSE
jgi:hypothetical protein